ncbi:MAG TPA: SBBP repeat-containing protein [Candidatus Acidoferrales bacterium]|nr:SBBP repeat-containing protein [Candidatus Acidoferrales bacterium]
MRSLACFGLLLCSASLLSAADGDVARAQAALAQLPLRFEENRGQWSSAVRYAARAGGYTLQLSADGAALAMPGAEHVDAERVEMVLVKANPAAEIVGLDRMPARTDYFVGSRQHWRTGVANYPRVQYRGVYPGIDVVYYGNQRSLEYDFVVQPGADPRAIRLQFRGGAKAADAKVKVNVTAEGDLALDLNGQRILQKKPLVYQDTAGGRRLVAGRYALVGRNEVALRLGDYDRTRTLVIDPVLVYCTYLGSSGADQITAMKLDSKGLLYITGSTTTGEIPFVNGAYNNNNAGLTDIFLAIVNTATADRSFPLVYFSYLGGAALDIPLGIDVDSKGVVYLTGTTTSTDFPVVGNSIANTGSGTEQQAFVSVIDPSQYGGVSLTYSTYLGGTTGTNAGRGIAVGPNGHIYVIGTTASTDFPVTTSAYAQVLFGPRDAFLCQLDPNSTSLVYSTYLGGELDDDGRSIAVGSNGLVYFAATTDSLQFPMEGPGFRQTQQQGVIGIIIGVMDMSQFGEPSLVYSTYFGGNAVGDVSEARKIVLDSKNRVMVTGYTLSSAFPTTPDAIQLRAGGNGDVFVSIVNPSDPPRFLVYSTYLGGSQGEVAYDLAGDAAGNIYVTGYTLSPDFPVKSAPQAAWGNGTNLFIAKIQPGTAGQTGLLFSTYFGAAGVYVGNGIAVGPDGSVYTAGYSTVGLPSSANGNGFAGGVSDGFLIVIK